MNLLTSPLVSQTSTHTGQQAAGSRVSSLLCCQIQMIITVALLDYAVDLH